MAGGMAVLLLYGEWLMNDYRVWVFQSSQSYGLSLSSRTRYKELLHMVEKILGIDVTTQRVQLTYQWPSFMLMDDGKDAPPVPIRTDAEVDCFLTVKADIPCLNLCATITELSPNFHEVVESNNVTTSHWSGDGIVGETSGTIEENNGAMVVYQGGNIPCSASEIAYDVPIIYRDKGKGKVVDGVECSRNIVATQVDLNIGCQPMEIDIHKPTRQARFDEGEGSNRKSCFEKSSWQTIYEELVGTSHASNLELLQIIQQHIPTVPNDPSLEAPILDDTVEEDGLDTHSIMGSALGIVEKLIAEEFDDVEQLVWDSPDDDETEEDNTNGTAREKVDIGRVFKDKTDFKLRVSMIAIKEKFCYRTLRSCRKFVELVCINLECPWRVFSSIVDGGLEFAVRSVHFDHTCGVDDRRHYHRHATVDVLSELIMPRFVGGRRGPSPVEIQRLVHVEHQLRISYWKAWKCREVAMEKVVGSIVGSYSLLPSYLANLVEHNPGSVGKLQCEDDLNGGKRFKYLFITYGASIQGLPFLRPIILIDGTHLRGRYGGCLLIASGQDGNFQTFPIAYAVVDSENDASYEWFLQSLLAVVDDHPKLVFISDRHPSITKGLEKLYPMAVHGACLVHLTRNVATKFSREKRLPGLVIRAGKAYTVFECAEALSEIEAISPACGKYLKDVGYTRWTRAYFLGDRYNIMTTNLAESLNNVLKECRELPIVAMLEAIRLSLQGWFSKRRNIANKDHHSLTPRVRAMLEPIFDESHYMQLFNINNGQYEIHDRAGSKFCVDLKKNSCSCRFWDIEKIPCPHALAAAHKDDIMAETLILDKYYQGYLQHTWAASIYPSPKAVVSEPRVLPPWTRRPPGRPKKQRFKSRVEMKRQSTNNRKCSRCLGRGHNKATCKRPLRHMPTE